MMMSTQANVAFPGQSTLLGKKNAGGHGFLLSKIKNTMKSINTAVKSQVIIFFMLNSLYESIYTYL